MTHERLVIWFSCGAASAVTAKICLEKYAGTHEITIARCVVANEHPDNDRFAEDCEKWFGQKIVNLRSEKYADCWEVWEKNRYLVSPYGAPCTAAMKKNVRFDFERDWCPDVQAYGYTIEEEKRAARFRQCNPDVNLITPLIDEFLRKADCLAMLRKAGIVIPAMYRMGFNNNNCIGCVKGGMGYWNHVRRVFPDVFERMSNLERKLGACVLGESLYLDELHPKAGRHKEPEIDCSLFCFRGESFYQWKEREETELC